MPGGSIDRSLENDRVFSRFIRTRICDSIEVLDGVISMCGLKFFRCFDFDFDFDSFDLHCISCASDDDDREGDSDSDTADEHGRRG